MAQRVRGWPASRHLFEASRRTLFWHLPEYPADSLVAGFSYAVGWQAWHLDSFAADVVAMPR